MLESKLPGQGEQQGGEVGYSVFLSNTSICCKHPALPKMGGEEVGACSTPQRGFSSLIPQFFSTCDEYFKLITISCLPQMGMRGCCRPYRDRGGKNSKNPLSPPKSNLGLSCFYTKYLRLGSMLLVMFSPMCRCVLAAGERRRRLEE